VLLVRLGLVDVALFGGVLGLTLLLTARVTATRSLSWVTAAPGLS
jgi:hypothetical protein